MNSKSKALKGYKGRDKIGHRRYSFKTAINRLHRTGKLTFRGQGTTKGSGHAAGEKWAAAKDIDPEEKETSYSKNSPSFDEGVLLYKEKVKGRVLANSKG